jgi:flagellar M-ring protein FliF
VSCFPLSISAEIEAPEETRTDWLDYGRQYIKPVINLVLLAVIFLFVVRPLLRSVKGIITTVDTSPKALPETYEESESVALPEPKAQHARGVRERAVLLAKNNTEKTEQVLKGWLQETE